MLKRDLMTPFPQEGLLAFQNTLSKLKELYAEALFARRKVGVKIYSEILGCYLWVVETDKDMHLLRSQGATKAIYAADEIKRLKGLSKDSLKEIHKVKEVFPESKVEEITKRRKAHKNDDQEDVTLWG